MTRARNSENATDYQTYTLPDFSFDELTLLIEKYSVSGPRYTSYPTAVEFNSTFSQHQWREQLAKDALVEQEHFSFDKAEQQRTVSLYLHIPFCHSLCYFCACNKIITKSRTGVDAYLRGLYREVDIYSRLLGGEVLVEQNHWGGGTPNYLTPAEMKELYGSCKRAFSSVVPDAEISVETDPRTITDKHIQVLAKLGFNRFSLGVQDFNPNVQKAINRVQSFELTQHVCDVARSEGFGGINLDLIYGLPGQTVSSFVDTVNKVLEIRPDRIALYGYAHVKWLQKVQKTLERTHLPEPSERIAIFVESVKRFTEAGYCYIGMDHFALPDDSLTQALTNGRLMRNFMGYTTHRGARVIGLGMSSISSLPRAFSQNTKDLTRYQAEMEGGHLPIERGLVKTQDDFLRSEIIQDILCQGHIDILEFEKRWDINFRDMFAESLLKLEELRKDGLVIIDAQRISLSPLGRLFMRNVAMTFDAYLNKHASSQKPMFSQTV